MPKSRRVKRSALTNVVSKGRELKTELVDSIRQAVDKYENLYVISFENMRSSLFKGMRAQMNDSRIFLGKNKVMALALGKTNADEYSTHLHKVGRVLIGKRSRIKQQEKKCLLLLLHISIDSLSAQFVVLTYFYSFSFFVSLSLIAIFVSYLTGNRCLLFSNDGPDVISKLFDANQVEDYARSGADAVSTVTLPQGPLPTMIHSMVDPLRKLGLQVTLNKGVVTLDADTDLCVKGTLLVNSKETFLLFFCFSCFHKSQC